MEPLLSELTSLFSELAPEVNLLQARVRIAGLLAAYDVKPVRITAGHPDITEKVKLFLSAKKLEGLSQNTLNSYTLDLKIFGNYVHKPIDQISTQDIRIFLGQFDKLKTSSISKKLSVLKSFFGWLTAEEIIGRDPTRKIKYPRQEKRMPKALSIEELEMLREACETARERALIEVLYASGCRLSEVQILNRQDVDWQRNSAKVFGKGAKEREVFFSWKALYHLKKYLKSREDAHPALIVTERHPVNRLSNRGIQRAIKAIAQRTNIQKNITPHVMRHTFATLTLNNGADLVAVQSLLGHANPATTQIYAQLTNGRKREQYQKHLVQ